MKKLLMIGILALCGLLLSVSCNPNVYAGAREWRVKNDTNQTLILKYPNLMAFDSEYIISKIEPGGSVALFLNFAKRESQDNLFFSSYFKLCVDHFGEDVYWQILSESGEVLKTYTYSDEGHGFFNKSSWVQGGGLYPGIENDMVTFWTFVIFGIDSVSNPPVK
jgi:hypothetical protein